MLGGARRYHREPCATQLSPQHGPERRCPPSPVSPASAGSSLLLPATQLSFRAPGCFRPFQPPPGPGRLVSVTTSQEPEPARPAGVATAGSRACRPPPRASMRVEWGPPSVGGDTARKQGLPAPGSHSFPSPKARTESLVCLPLMGLCPHRHTVPDCPS